MATTDNEIPPAKNTNDPGAHFDVKMTPREKAELEGWRRGRLDCANDLRIALLHKDPEFREFVIERCLDWYAQGCGAES